MAHTNCLMDLRQFLLTEIYAGFSHFIYTIFRARLMDPAHMCVKADSNDTMIIIPFHVSHLFSTTLFLHVLWPLILARTPWPQHNKQDEVRSHT